MRSEEGGFATKTALGMTGISFGKRARPDGWSSCAFRVKCRAYGAGADVECFPALTGWANL